MSSLAISFDRSGFARFLNTPAGRALRLAAGIGFIVVGLIFHTHLLGIASFVWGFFPLTAGTFDICYVSAALGGPLKGKKVREIQQTD